MASVTPQKIHADAQQAHHYTEQVATDLAAAGAEDEVVDAVKQCAAVLKKVVSIAGKSSGAEEAEPEQAKQVERDASAPRETMQSATESLAAEAQARAAQRQ